MEEQTPVSSKRKLGRSAGLVAAGLIAGGILAGTLAAGAQSPSSQPSAQTNPPAAGRAFDRAGPGPGETLLTGTTAEKVKAAALKAVPGGRIIRVETDADGSPYEAHMTNADGSMVTVKVSSSFAVTSIEEGHGKRTN